MTLHDQIAALPEWPNMEDYCCPSVNKDAEALRYHQVALSAALARLALARRALDDDWIYQCMRQHLDMSPDEINALLAALEMPK